VVVDIAKTRRTDAFILTRLVVPAADIRKDWRTQLRCGSYTRVADQFVEFSGEISIERDGEAVHRASQQRNDIDLSNRTALIPQAAIM
jgi:hypothetical protein